MTSVVKDILAKIAPTLQQMYRVTGGHGQIRLKPQTMEYILRTFVEEYCFTFTLRCKASFMQHSLMNQICTFLFDNIMILLRSHVILLTCQDVFTRDGLNHLWNEMMKDGELVLMTEKVSSSDELANSVGAVARRGRCLYNTHSPACV